MIATDEVAATVNPSFLLFVAGQSPRSMRAIANLEALGRERLGDRYELEVVDVLDRPEMAEQHRILATPTLVKQAPDPGRRVMGDLSDFEMVLKGLGLTPVPEAPASPGQENR